MSLLASLQVDPDNDSVLVRIPEDALTLPGGSDHFLADLGILRNRRQ